MSSPCGDAFESLQQIRFDPGCISTLFALAMSSPERPQQEGPRPSKMMRLDTDTLSECEISSPEKLVAWPSEVPVLEDRLLAEFGIQSRLRDNLFKNKIYITSAYSGMCTFEHLIQRLASAKTPARDGILSEGTSDIVLWSCFEVDHACRQFVLNSELRPLHMFGDLTEQVKQPVLDQMNFVVNTLKERADRFKQEHKGKSGKDAKAAMQKEMESLNTRCMTKLKQLVHRAYQEGDVRYEGFCYVCEKVCSYDPPMKHGDIRLECGGNACIAFSPQGLRQRWLHPTAVPAAVWFGSAACHSVDFLLQECSHCFNTEECLALFYPPEAGWTSTVLQLCPEEVGVPMKRPRKFSWTVGEKYSMQVDFTKQLFLSLCSAEIVMDAHSFWCLPAEQVQVGLSALTLQRGLAIEGEPNGRSALTAGCQDRLDEYEERLSEHYLGGKVMPSLPIWDLSQNVKVRESFSHMFPSVLRNSVVFSKQHGREILPVELFQAFGWPSMLGSEAFPFHDAATDCVDCRKIQQMIGNSVHCRVAGLFLAMALMLTERKDASSGSSAT